MKSCHYVIKKKATTTITFKQHLHISYLQTRLSSSQSLQSIGYELTITFTWLPIFMNVCIYEL